MVRIAPVRLAYNPRTLWFDAREFELKPGDNVVVQTARGLEFGSVDESVFEGTSDQVKSLKSSLKPVRRIATEEDVEHAHELERKNLDALPVFRELAASKTPDMNPVSVEFLFDGDKAIFYFESEERIDFRDLVRDLASKFHIRVDMKQIGVRDEARMVGGIGHCGQELCCRRLGGDFNPVSIRMAKEQGMSLNPQKISGLCGRLMCCLRYEYDAYKDFHGRAPKKNAKIQTPDGEGKVVDMDVPREMISIAIEGEKPVKIALADMETVNDAARPNAVGEEAWELAHEETHSGMMDSGNLLTSQFTAGDKLADRTRVRTVGDGKQSSKEGSRRRRRRGSESQAQTQPVEHKARRRRSTKVSADGTTSTVEGAQGGAAAKGARAAGQGTSSPAHQGEGKGESASSRRRRRSRSPQAKQGAQAESKPKRAKQGQPKQGAQAKDGQPKQNGQAKRPGRKSSSLRGAHPEDASASSPTKPTAPTDVTVHRRRRRSHKAGESAGENGKTEQ